MTVIIAGSGCGSGRRAFAVPD
jgi:hypothetical protein